MVTPAFPGSGYWKVSSVLYLRTNWEVQRQTVPERSESEPVQIWPQQQQLEREKMRPRKTDMVPKVSDGHELIISSFLAKASQVRFLHRQSCVCLHPHLPDGCGLTAWAIHFGMRAWAAFSVTQLIVLVFVLSLHRSAWPREQGHRSDAITECLTNNELN